MMHDKHPKDAKPTGVHHYTYFPKQWARAFIESRLASYSSSLGSIIYHG
ncbi:MULTISPECIES: hypothetical protein [unclassified Lentimonas]|nr:MULTISPECIES: hypothetical protein [unclassified Lentimonas]